MGYGYVIYLDVLALLLVANFVFDYLLLWATAEVARARTNIGRLSAGAFTGVLYFLGLWLANLQIIPYYGLLRTVPVVLAVAALMLAIAFAPLNAKRFASVAGYFLMIGCIAAGAGMGTAYLFGSPQDLNELAGIIAALATILVVAELGWGVVQKRMWQKLYQLPIEVAFGESKIRVNALIDTGNNLRDPVTGAPVIILEYNAIEKLLPRKLRPIILKMDKGDLSSISHLLASSRWSARFRIIPFSSIGTDNGLLVGFRPSSVTVYAEGEPVIIREVIVGIHNQQLDPDGVYQALVHPKVLELAAGMTQQHNHALTRGKSTDAKKLEA